MTTQELHALIDAYDNGKEIEYYTGEWNGSPVWQPVESIDDLLLHISNGDNIRYAIKSEYIPYNTVEEFLTASKIHGPYIKCPDDEYILPERINNGIIEWTKRNIAADNFSSLMNYKTFNDLLNDKYTWQDGTPCGIKKEED